MLELSLEGRAGLGYVESAGIRRNIMKELLGPSKRASQTRESLVRVSVRFS